MPGHHKPAKKEIAKVRKNWIMLVEQHTAKACYICTGCKTYPENKDLISQQRIFAAQKSKYLSNDETVAILNAFPLFLFEYFKELNV